MASIPSLPRPAPEKPPNSAPTRSDTEGFSPEYLAEMAAYARELKKNMRRQRPKRYRAVYVNPEGPRDEDTYQKVLRWIRGLAR